MMRLFVVAIALVAIASAEKVKFDNYKVYRIIPSSEEHLDVLKELENFEGDAYQYWQSPSRVFEPVDLMVAPENADEFSNLMDLADMRYETFVEDVQKLINEDAKTLRARAGSKFDWTRYHTLEEIYNFLESLGEKYPNNVEVVDAGKTYQGRAIKGVKLSFGQEKPGVFIEGGIHAREWISPATVTYLINEFLSSNRTEVRKLAESYNWYIFPSFNPDGYVYTHTTNRLWRKTVSKSSIFCKGTDANRNWDYKWMVVGASNNPCSETYAGKSAFSEIETRTMSEYIKSISGKLFAYISFHSYSQLLMFPYGHTEEHLDNYDESLTIGQKSIEALAKRYGTQYRTGNIAETIYPATGSTTDWVKGTLGLPVSFVYELRDTGRYGFLLPASQIIPNGQEVMDSLIVMFQESAKFGYPKPQ